MSKGAHTACQKCGYACPRHTPEPLCTSYEQCISVLAVWLWRRVSCPRHHVQTTVHIHIEVSCPFTHPFTMTALSHCMLARLEFGPVNMWLCVTNCAGCAQLMYGHSLTPQLTAVLLQSWVLVINTPIHLLWMKLLKPWTLSCWQPSRVLCRWRWMRLSRCYCLEIQAHDEALTREADTRGCCAGLASGVSKWTHGQLHVHSC